MQPPEEHTKSKAPRANRFRGLRQIDCADVLGMHERRFRQLVRDGVFRRPDGNAGFDLREVVAAYVQYVEQGRRPGGVAESRAALMRAKAAQARIQTDILRGNVFPREEVEAVFAASMTMLANHLAGLGGRLCHELANMTEPAMIAVLINREVRAIRQRAADGFEKLRKEGPPSWRQKEGQEDEADNDEGSPRAHPRGRRARRAARL